MARRTLGLLRRRCYWRTAPGTHSLKFQLITLDSGGLTVSSRDGPYRDSGNLGLPRGTGPAWVLPTFHSVPHTFLKPLHCTRTHTWHLLITPHLSYLTWDRGEVLRGCFLNIHTIHTHTFATTYKAGFLPSHCLAFHPGLHSPFQTAACTHSMHRRDAGPGHHCTPLKDFGTYNHPAHAPKPVPFPADLFCYLASCFYRTSATRLSNR